MHDCSKTVVANVIQFTTHILNLGLTLATACPPKVDSKFKVELSNVVRDNHFAKQCNVKHRFVCFTMCGLHVLLEVG